MLNTYILSVLALLVFSTMRRRGLAACMAVTIATAFIFFQSSLVSDWAEYRKLYEWFMQGRILYHANEPLYVGVMQVGSFLELDYTSLRMSIFAVALALNLMVLIQSGANTAIFLVCYLIYPFFIEGLQLRGYLAISLMTTSMFLSLRSKHPDSLMLIGIILATLVQKSFAMFLLTVVFRHFRLNGKWGQRAIICTALPLLIMQLRNSTLSRFVSLDGDTATYINAQVHLGWIIPLAMLLSLLAVQRYIFSVITKFGSSSPSGESYTQILSPINMVAVFSLPFCAVNLSFYRYIRYAYFISIMVFSAIVPGVHCRKRRFRLICMLVVLSVLFLVCDCIIHGDLLNLISDSIFHL